MIARDCGSTGALEMSRFHQFVAGKTWREEKSSRRTMPSCGSPPRRGLVLSPQPVVAMAIASAVAAGRYRHGRISSRLSALGYGHTTVRLGAP
jgi:hypothetical protein